MVIIKITNKNKKVLEAEEAEGCCFLFSCLVLGFFFFNNLVGNPPEALLALLTR